MHVLGRNKRGPSLYPAHARVSDQNFWRAFLGILTWSAFVTPQFAPRRYPEHARSRDMARIGADMYRGFQVFHVEEESTKSTAG